MTFKYDVGLTEGKPARRDRLVHARNLQYLLFARHLFVEKRDPAS
jgi:hypothetical protein